MSCHNKNGSPFESAAIVLVDGTIFCGRFGEISEKHFELGTTGEQLLRLRA